MRLVKMLGLAMVAAIATMALFGTASASAATACKSVEYEKECAVGNRYANGTTIKAQLVAGTEAILKSKVEEKCKKSTVTGKLTENGKEEIKGEVTGLTFTECAPCTEVVVEALPYSAQLKWISFSLGPPPQQQDSFQVHLFKVLLQKCTFGEQCTATGTITLNWHSTGVTGGTKVTTVASGANNVEKVKCAILGESTGEWNAEYEVTEPTPLWISEKP